MGRNPLGRRKYQLQTMWDRHREINRRLAVGQTPTQVAKEMGVTPAMVTYTKNSHLAMQERTVLQRELDMKAVDVGKRIRDEAALCVERLSQIRDDPTCPAATRAKVCMDLLDRAGFGAIHRTQNENITAHLTGEEIEELKQRGREAGIIVEMTGTDDGAE